MKLIGDDGEWVRSVEWRKKRGKREKREMKTKY